MAAIPLAYILPGLAYIEMEPHSLFSREKLPAVGLVAFGTVVTLAGAGVLLPSLMGDCKSNDVLDYCKNYDVAVNVTKEMSKFLKNAS